MYTYFQIIIAIGLCILFSKLFINNKKRLKEIIISLLIIIETTIIFQILFGQNYYWSEVIINFINNHLIYAISLGFLLPVFKDIILLNNGYVPYPKKEEK